MIQNAFAVAATALVLLGAPPAHHDPRHGDFAGSAVEGGTRIGVISADTLRQWAAELLTNGDDGPWSEYASASPCGGHPDRAESDNLCGRAVTLCAGGLNGEGPAVAVFSRQVDSEGRPLPGPSGRWLARGFTCFPGFVPGAGRALTMAMIREAFHDTDFSVPTLNIQPEGDVTLVNLPTFFQVVFPEDGFGPEEVDTPDPDRLLGYRIQVRPLLKSVTYQLGDQVVGPTTSLGGPYPSGDIRATYRQPAPTTCSRRSSTPASSGSEAASGSTSRVRWACPVPR